LARGKIRRTKKPSKNLACKGKIKYTKAYAKRNARDRSRDTGGIYKAYGCQHGCKLENGDRAWHIGHAYPSKF